MSLSRSVLPSSSRLAIPITRVAKRKHIRHYAASPSINSPSPKISCVPFNQKPEDAMIKLRNYGLLASSRASNILYAALLRIFGEGITPLAREFGLGSNFQLKDMKAAYYPVWRVDAILDGVLMNKTNQENNAWIGVREGYVPGNPFAPLSYISYAIPPLPDDLPRYNPTKDLHQLGEGYDIVPIPFTVSPLGLISKIRKIIGKQTDWQEYKIDESKWKETMIACYPIMFPIYIAEFEDKTLDKKRRFHVILDAHDSDIAQCRATFSPPAWLRAEGRLDNNFFANPAPFLPQSEFRITTSKLPSDQIDLLSQTPSVSLNITNSGSKDSISNQLTEIYQRWMSPPPLVPSETDVLFPSPLVEVEEELGRVDWEDVRIQNWSGEERLENSEFVDKGLQIRMRLNTLLLSSTLDSNLSPETLVKTLTMSMEDGLLPKVETKMISEIRQEREMAVKKMKEELMEIKPRWLKHFEDERKQEHE